MSSSTRTTPTQTQRGQILGHYQAGTSVASISKITGVKEKTIYGIIERYKKRGNVDVKPHTGRPSVVTPRGKRQILNDITNNPWHTVKQIAAAPQSLRPSGPAKSIKMVNQYGWRTIVQFMPRLKSKSGGRYTPWLYSNTHLIAQT